MRVFVMSIDSNFVLEFIDKGPETGGFSRVLGVVGIISIFMYSG